MNEKDIFDKYLQLFRKYSIPTKKLCAGEVWLRGRIHCDTFKVSFDDLDEVIEVPYFKKEIEAPPKDKTKSYRFNRENQVVLYLTSDEQTCISEIRLKENEICSISKFSCVKEGIYVDVISMTKDDELKPLADIMLKSKEGNERIYEVTQFISDILKEMGFSGILYPSTLDICTGLNLLCYYPEYFEFVMYSDRIFKGVRDESGNIIPLSQMEEFKKYPNYRTEMYSFGDTAEKEKEFEYIEDKIEFIDNQDYNNRVNYILSLSDSSKIESELDDFVVYFSKTHLRQQAYRFRGTYYINKGMSEIGIKDYIVSSKGKRDTIIENIIKDIFNNRNINNAFKTEELKRKIGEECHKYFLENENRKEKLLEELKLLDL